MKSMLYVFISVILTAAAAAAQGTAPTIADNATPQDNAIKMRSVELERVKREAAKKDGSTAPAINTAVESKFPEIKEDFEGIQIAEAAIIKTYTTDKVIDYSLIAISAENIGKHAGWQLLLHSPTERHKLALAVRFPGGEPAQVQLFEILPEP